MKKYKMSKELKAALANVKVYKDAVCNFDGWKESKDVENALKLHKKSKDQRLKTVQELIDRELTGRYFMWVEKSPKSKPINLWHFEELKYNEWGQLSVSGMHVDMMNLNDPKFFYLNIQRAGCMGIPMQNLHMLKMQELTKAEFKRMLAQFTKKAAELVK